MTEKHELIQAIVQWSCTYLSTHGYTLKHEVTENVQETPWSYVARFATTDGYIYVAISHPFFSLINCLQQVKKHYALTEKDDIYLKIQNACLRNYLNFDVKKHLLEAFEIATRLFFIYGALCNYRLMVACGKEKFTSAFQRHGRPALPLKELLSVMR